jgi:hypothetical protein
MRPNRIAFALHSIARSAGAGAIARCQLIHAEASLSVSRIVRSVSRISRHRAYTAHRTVFFSSALRDIVIAAAQTSTY